jgi:RHS repeat-associated protein
MPKNLLSISRAYSAHAVAPVCDRLETRRLLVQVVGGGLDLGGTSHGFYADLNEPASGPLGNGVLMVENLSKGYTADRDAPGWSWSASATEVDVLIDESNEFAATYLPDGNYEFTLFGRDVVASSPFETTSRINDATTFFLNGDFNRDRRVDLADWGIQQQNFGRTDASFLNGDADGDADVDDDDVAIVRLRFGSILPAVPAGAGSLSVGLATSSRITLNWAVPDSYDAFAVYRNTGDGFEQQATLRNDDGDYFTNFSVEDGIGTWTQHFLEDGTQHQYYLRAVLDGVGESEATETALTTTLLPAPQITSLSENDDGTWDVAWDSWSDNQGEFHLTYSRDGGATWSDAGNVGKYTNSYSGVHVGTSTSASIKFQLRAEADLQKAIVIDDIDSLMLSAPEIEEDVAQNSLVVTDPPPPPPLPPVNPVFDKFTPRHVRGESDPWTVKDGYGHPDSPFLAEIGEDGTIIRLRPKSEIPGYRGETARGPWASRPSATWPTLPAEPTPPIDPRIEPWSPVPGSGVLFYAETDAVTHSTGHDWGHTRSYTTDPNFEHRNVNGRGWMIHEQAFVKPWATDRPGGISYAIISGGTGPRIFDRQADGTYNARAGGAGSFDFDETLDLITYIDGAGTLSKFHGFSADTLLAGSLQSVEDIGGGKTIVEERVPAGQRNEGAASVLRRYDADDTLLEEYIYSYGSQEGGYWDYGRDASSSRFITCVMYKLPNGQIVSLDFSPDGPPTYLPRREIDLLSTLEVRTRAPNGLLKTNQVVSYDYYGFNDVAASSDATGDRPYGHLARVTTVRLDGQGEYSADSSYYRYSGGSADVAGGLSAILDDAGADRMVADGLDPLVASTSTFNQYARDRFYFNERTGQVISHIDNGAAGRGRTSYQHEESRFSRSDFWRSTVDPRTTWANVTHKTFDTPVDSSTKDRESVFVNFYGQPLLDVRRDGATGEEFATYYRYADDGTLVFKADPSAVLDYDRSLPGLVGILPNGTSTHIADHDGLLHVYEGWDATDPSATSTSPGGVEGKLKRYSLARGEMAAELIPVREQSWLLGGGDGDIPFPADTTAFPTGDENAPLVVEEVRYEWYTNSNLPQSITRTQPSVSIGENGDGSTKTSSTTWLDRDGHPRWTAHADGTLTYAEFDATTDALTLLIEDADPSRTTYNPTGLPPEPDALHLMTHVEVDARGRTLATTRPDGVVDYFVWNDNSAIRHTPEDVRIYAAWDPTTERTASGSVRIGKSKQAPIRETLVYLDVPSVDPISRRPTGQEAIMSPESLQRVRYDSLGRVVEVQSYSDFNDLLPATVAGSFDNLPRFFGVRDQNFYSEHFAYDKAHRLVESTDWTNTIETYSLDALGRLLEVAVGVKGGATNPLTQTVAQYSYDKRQSLGDTPNSVTLPARDGDGVSRTLFDWRGRVVLTLVGYDEATGEAVGGYYATYDNLSRLTKSEYYSLHGVSFAGAFGADGDNFDADGDGVPDRPAAADRRSESRYHYDVRSRVYRTEESFYERDGTAVSGLIWSDTTFDPAGRVARTRDGGTDLAQKFSYDRSGRLTEVAAVDASNDNVYADALSTDDDIVYEQTNFTFDDSGRLLKESTYRRWHDAPALSTGDLSASGMPARASHTAHYYDAFGRGTETVRFGTNGGQPFTRPATPPSRNGDFDYDVLIESVRYDDVGRVGEVIDPRGIPTKYDYDALGRVTRVIEAFVDGVPSDGDDRITETDYGPAGPEVVRAVLPGGDVQETAYYYGARIADGDGIDDNRVHTATFYPDPSTGIWDPNGWLPSQREEWTVGRQYETLTSTDRNGTSRAYTYDRLGRTIEDRVTAFGPGVDDAVTRLGFAYDNEGFGSLARATSYAAADAVANEVVRDYDALGRLATEHQQHDGAVVVGTSPAVGYVYDLLQPCGCGSTRLTEIVYPDGRRVGFDYDDLGRLTALTDGPVGTSPVLESYEYLGLSGLVERVLPEPDVRWTLLGDTATSSDSGDAYAGLDRFGRLVDHRWTTGTGTDLEGHRYGYDPNGNRLFEQNLVAPTRSEIYHDAPTATGYDALDRLTSFARGTLQDADNDGTFDGVANVSRDQSWQLDALGNWQSTTTDGTAEARTHDAQNRLSTVDGTPLVYSAAGEMTRDETGQTLGYDAWGGLVAVDPDPTATGDEITYAYDATGRRVTQDGRQLVYDGGQVIEERDAVTGSTVAQYVWSPVYVDAMVLRDRDSDGDGTLDERVYALHDANYDVTALVDASGVVIERYAYDAYGERTVLDGDLTADADDESDVGFVHGHQGGRHDLAAGLVSFDHRDFDTSLGRWTRQDPAGFVDGLNTYHGYRGGPVSGVDPTGLFMLWFVCEDADGQTNCRDGSWSTALEDNANAEWWRHVIEAGKGILWITGKEVAIELATGPLPAGVFRGGRAAAQHGPDLARAARAGMNAGGDTAKAADKARDTARAADAATEAGPAASKGADAASDASKGPQYAPDRALPRDNDGVPVPDTDSAHTQLGNRSREKGSNYPAAREWDDKGNVVREVHSTDHGRPNIPGHTNPHQHRWQPNPNNPHGSPTRGDPEPIP